MKSTIAIAIENHLAAVHVDEASFTADGIAIDEGVADQTLKADLSAFGALVQYPCETAADVQAKLIYMLDGTVGEREHLLIALQERGEFVYFLRSPALPDNLVRDARPARGAWAPGNQIARWRDCDRRFRGGPMAKECAECAYGDGDSK